MLLLGLLLALATQPATALSLDDLSNLSTGAWIGIGAGVLLVVVLLVSCCCCCCGRCCRKDRKRDAGPTNEHYAGPAPGQYYQPPPASPAHAIDMQPPLFQGSKQLRQQTNQSAVTSVETGYSWPTGSSHNSGNVGTSTRSSGLWDDPAIVAARIPFEHVHLGELLSRGGFGEVYRGSYRGQQVAVKALLPATRKDMAHIEAFLGEIKLMATLEHESIVRFVGVAWESLSELYAVSEFMDGGDLRSLMVAFKSEGRPQGFDGDKARMGKQIAHALTYLHSLDPVVLHRDLKSRNVLLTRGLDAKLTDFGTARETVVDKTMTAGVGTSLWMAPEVVMGERYGEKADVFSLGVVLAEMDTHELPYARAMAGEDTATGVDANGSRRALPEAAVLQLVVLGRLRVDVSGWSPPALTALVQDCVEVNPNARPSAAEALYRLHTIAKEFNQEGVEF
jgi:serine/threonine protein kinase